MSIAGNLPCRKQFSHQNQQVLRAPDRKRWDHHVPVPAHQRVGKRKRKLVQRLRPVLVKAVAVGGLDQQHVGGFDRRRIAHDRVPRLPQIAGEHEPDFFARAGRCRGSPSRVCGPRRGRCNSRRTRVRTWYLIRDRHQPLEAGVCVLHGVQGCPRCAASPSRVPHLLLLQVRAVGQHHLEQLAGGGCGVDRTAESRSRPAAAAGPNDRYVRATAGRSRSTPDRTRSARKLRASAARPPWNMPQSMRNRVFPVSTR